MDAANKKLQNNKFDEAIKDYNKAIKINKKYAKAFNNRGVAYFNKGEYNKALDYFNKASKLNPIFRKH